MSVRPKCIPRQLPHTGGDAVHDMKRHGPTTQDNQEEPPGVLG